MKHVKFVPLLMMLGASLSASAQSKGVNGPTQPVQVGSVILNLVLSAPKPLWKWAFGKLVPV
jgi:hypothetical protein